MTKNWLEYDRNRQTLLTYFNFHSYSPINVRHGNIYYIFSQVHDVKFVVVNFSFKFTNFGHLDSVKWLTLFVIAETMC